MNPGLFFLWHPFCLLRDNTVETACKTSIISFFVSYFSTKNKMLSGFQFMALTYIAIVIIYIAFLEVTPWWTIMKVYSLNIFTITINVDLVDFLKQFLFLLFEHNFDRIPNTFECTYWWECLFFKEIILIAACFASPLKTVYIIIQGELTAVEIGIAFFSVGNSVHS